MDESISREEFEEIKSKQEELERELEEVKRNPITRNVDNQTEDRLREISQGSIFELVWDNTFSYTTDFQSLDGFSTATIGNLSGVALSGGGVNLAAHDSGGGAATASIDRIISPSSRFNFDENSRFRFEIASSANDNFDLDVVVGAVGNNTAYGFRIEDSVIKGITTDASATNEVTLNTAFDATSSVMKLEARYYQTSRVDFFINDVLEGSSTSNLPDTSTTILWGADISTTSYSGNSRDVTIYFVDYFQRKQ